MSSFIHAMRKSTDGRLLCISCDQESIRIWDTTTLREIANVQPGFSGGSERIAIDPATSRLFSGLWEGGLTCYDYSADRVLWRREDIVGIQGVAQSPAFSTSVFVELEAPDYRVDEPGVFSGIVELDARTGEEKWQTNDADSIYLHPKRPVLVLKSRAARLVRILDASRKQLGSRPMANFAVLDVVFWGDLIALAEGAKGGRVVSWDGSVVVSYCPTSRDCNCLWVSFAGETRALTVVDSGEKTFVTKLDFSGRVLSEYAREDHMDVCFFDDGARFVDADGNVCRTSDGAVEARLDI